MAAAKKLATPVMTLPLLPRARARRRRRNLARRLRRIRMAELVKTLVVSENACGRSHGGTGALARVYTVKVQFRGSNDEEGGDDVMDDDEEEEEDAAGEDTGKVSFSRMARAFERDFAKKMYGEIRQELRRRGASRGKIHAGREEGTRGVDRAVAGRMRRRTRRRRAAPERRRKNRRRRRRNARRARTKTATPTPTPTRTRRAPRPKTAEARAGTTARGSPRRKKRRERRRRPRRRLFARRVPTTRRGLMTTTRARDPRTTWPPPSRIPRTTWPPRGTPRPSLGRGRRRRPKKPRRRLVPGRFDGIAGRHCRLRPRGQGREDVPADPLASTGRAPPVDARDRRGCGGGGGGALGPGHR